MNDKMSLTPTPKRSLFSDDEDDIYVKPNRSLFSDDDDEDIYVKPNRSLFMEDKESDMSDDMSLFGDEENEDDDVDSKSEYINHINDINLEDYNISSPLPRIESFMALHNYLTDVKRKNLLCSMDMEWLVKKESFGSTPSNKDTETFKVYTKNELLSAIGTKLMKDTHQSRKEIEYYNYFTHLVLTNQTPHFPLVSVSQECELCEGISNRIENSIVVFSELADGSALNYFPQRMDNVKLPEMLSMICQVMMACLILEMKGIVHGDLHFGNILYHSEEEEVKNTNKYFHYMYGDKHIYVKHKGKLWVLWDFGLMTRNGEINPEHGEINTNTLGVDISRLFNLSNIRLRRFNIELDGSRFSDIFSLLIYLSQQNFFKDDILIISDVPKTNLETIYPDYIINGL